MFTFNKPSLKGTGRRNLIILAIIVAAAIVLLTIQHEYFPAPSGLVRDWALDAEQFIEGLVKLLDYILGFLMLLLVLVFFKKRRGGSG